MIKTLVVNHQNELQKDLPISTILTSDFKWYWIDFIQPTEDEIRFLDHPLSFHPLAIEDCIHKLQRPKLDYYDDHTFFVTHSLNDETLEKEEINLFIGKNYVVTFHHLPSKEIADVWDKVCLSKMIDQWNQSIVLYHVLDKLVDGYFPIVYKLEDVLNEIEDNSKKQSMEKLLENLFDARHDLLSLRNTVNPMRDLLYRMLNSQRLDEIISNKEYFADIYDHLLKLSEMVDANREITTDLRDSYLSYNSHQTNRVMKILTVITTIFMPLTFIAGVYGMNFEHMPELRWDWGYFLILSIMFIIGFSMFLWFKKKGWFI
ncbi:magnesium/cobalt transporter CorA [Cytobacillus sp. FJAT-54145]|uniref:Magnesium transport protein CorA n=1 Tax=Cytobacillus spartinae TaxID=3299023 RepID=A0ABW6K5T7_9BACI